MSTPSTCPVGPTWAWLYLLQSVQNIDLDSRNVCVCAMNDKIQINYVQLTGRVIAKCILYSSLPPWQRWSNQCQRHCPGLVRPGGCWLNISQSTSRSSKNKYQHHHMMSILDITHADLSCCNIAGVSLGICATEQFICFQQNWFYIDPKQICRHIMTAKLIHLHMNTHKEMIRNVFYYINFQKHL